MQLKTRFFMAIISGELGKTDDKGVIVELKDFKKYFSDVTTDYVNSFLPAATIEKGLSSMSHTKYVFRLKKGIYRAHPDALEDQTRLLNKSHNSAIETMMIRCLQKDDMAS